MCFAGGVCLPWYFRTGRDADGTSDPRCRSCHLKNVIIGMATNIFGPSRNNWSDYDYNLYLKGKEEFCIPSNAAITKNSDQRRQLSRTPLSGEAASQTEKEAWENQIEKYKEEPHPVQKFFYGLSLFPSWC